MNQQRMSKGAVRSRAPERERGGVFVCVIVCLRECVCVAALAVCASVSPPQPLQVAKLGFCSAVLRRAGLCLYRLSSLWIVCLLQGSGARWVAVATAVAEEDKKEEKEEEEGAVTALGIQILQLPLPPFPPH